MITNLLQTCASSLFWGLIITSSIMVILYFILKNLSRGCVKSIPFFIAFPVCFFILLYNSTLLVGAAKAKGCVDSVELYVRQLVADKNFTVDILQSQEILNEVNNEFPIISSFINLADFSGNESQNLAEAMCDEMNHFFNIFIWKKIGWIFGFTILMFIIAVVSYKGSGGNANRNQRRRSERNGERMSIRSARSTAPRRLTRIPRRNIR